MADPLSVIAYPVAKAFTHHWLPFPLRPLSETNPRLTRLGEEV